MGQAKNRGTFEERKARAVSEGRIKTANKKEKPTRGGIYSGIDYNLTLAEAMMMLQFARQGRK